MEFGKVRDVRGLPSLADEPCRYPDARPPASRTAFALHGAELRELHGPLDAAALDAWLAARGGGFAARTALLAVGSNAYPRQLFDKFEGCAGADQGIATVPARLDGYGAAFCPALSRRGYAPLTLSRRPGRAESTWLQWLTEAQLERVRETEGPRYALLGGGALTAALTPPSGWERPAAVYAWWFDSLLREAEGGGAVWFDARDDRAEARLLARLIGSEAWDGCRVPARLRAALTQRLAAAAAPNPAPAGWDRLA